MTATQTKQASSGTVVTDETGSYLLTNLPVGPYRFEAGLPGFRTYVQTGIVLQVNANPVVNAVLEVGQITDQIEVQADAALVETRSTGVGQVIDNVRVLEMPLNGRQVTDLIILLGSSCWRRQPNDEPQLSNRCDFRGRRNEQRFDLLTGWGNTQRSLQRTQSSPSVPGCPAGVQSRDQRCDGSVRTALGRSGQCGDQIGDEQFSRRLFEFLRNGSMNARNAFALKNDGLKRNQFGGTFGGPIVKSKLLFFGGFQGTTERARPSDIFAYIPTPAMLAGDWTAITAPACNGGRQINLRAPFVNNRIDPSLLALPSVNLAKMLPVTTDPCGYLPFSLPFKQDEQVYIGKVDYVRNDKHTIFTRYQRHKLDSPTGYDGENLLTVTRPDYLRTAQSAILGDTYLFNANTVATTRATLLRTTNAKTFDYDVVTWARLGVKNWYTHPLAPKIPDLSVANGPRIGGGDPRVSGQVTPGVGNATVWSLSEDVSTIKGGHQITFGGTYIYQRLYSNASTDAVGSMTFVATNTGLGLGDFMTGQLESFRQSGYNSWYQSQPYYGLYVQDTWKANSHLTLNGGVRWEPYHSMREKQQRFAYFDKASFDKGIHSTVFKNAPAGLLYPGDSGVPDTTTFGPNYYLKRFVPRVGLAWDPKGDGKMTVRASYGLFWDYPHMYAYGDTRDEPPFGGQITVPSPAGGLSDPWLGIPGGNPFPFFLGPNANFPPSGDYYWTPPKSLGGVKSPYANQWGLSIQRQIGDWLVAANYLGSNVIHVANGYEANPVVFLPGANCVINGVTYTPCSSTANTRQRRLLSLQNPVEGSRFNDLRYYGTHGTRNYNGMLLSIQSRRYPRPDITSELYVRTLY